MMITFLAQANPTPVDLSQAYSFGRFSSLSDALQPFITVAFSVATVAVVFFFIIGAFRWLISGGDKNAISDAQKMITHAIIGFILLALIFVIIQFVFEAFGIHFRLF